MQCKAARFGRNMLQWLKDAMAPTALVVALATASVALVQLTETKRALSLNSFLAIKEGYSEPKMQFYAWAFSNAKHFAAQENQPNDMVFIEYLAHLHITEYLRSIEFTCNAYLQGLLSKDAEQYVERLIKSDIENLLLYFYDADEGTIALNGYGPASWIKSDNDNPQRSKLGGYPSTLKCVDQWGIKLRKRTIF